MSKEWMTGEIHDRKMQEVLREWACNTFLTESQLRQAIEELGSILNLSVEDEEYILRIDED